MHVPVINIRKNTLVRYGFQCLLEREFGIYLQVDDLDRLELARESIEIYETVQEFFDKTGENFWIAIIVSAGRFLNWIREEM